MNDSASVFWAAFGGAFAAGVITLIAVLAAEWFRCFLDRPLVKAGMGLGFIPGYAFADDRNWYVFLEANNPHSKPVTLSTFGIMYKRKKWGRIEVTPSLGYQFPYQLDGGKSLTQVTPVQELISTLKKAGRTPQDLGYVYFKSSTGKVFRDKIDRESLEGLQKAYQQEAAGADDR